MSEIGEKLRRARLEAKMTQSVLSDGIVTRNMLSRIENGAARPSIGTLRALSARLGLSAGYFLESNIGELESHKAALIGDIRACMAKHDYSGAIERCAPFEGREDDEINFILAVCFYHEAVRLYTDGNFRALILTAAAAENRASHTVYPMPKIAEHCELCLKSAETYKSGGVYFPIPPNDYNGDVKIFSAAMKLALAGEAQGAKFICTDLPESAYKKLITLEAEASVSEYEAAAMSYSADIPFMVYIYRKLKDIYTAKMDSDAEYKYSTALKETEDRIKL